VRPLTVPTTTRQDHPLRPGALSRTKSLARSSFAVGTHLGVLHVLAGAVLHPAVPVRGSLPGLPAPGDHASRVPRPEPTRASSTSPGTMNHHLRRDRPTEAEERSEQHAGGPSSSAGPGPGPIRPAGGHGHPQEPADCCLPVIGVDLAPHVLDEPAQVPLWPPVSRPRRSGWRA